MVCERSLSVFLEPAQHQDHSRVEPLDAFGLQFLRHAKVRLGDPAGDTGPGVGIPAHGHGGADFVLSEFDEKDRLLCGEVIDAAADALMHPSYREGFPNVVIEAGAMGLPSIVTDINGSREIILNGTNGIIVPAHSEEALYEAMKRFVTNPHLVHSFAAVARDKVADRYQQDYVHQCIKDFYHMVLQ